MSLSLTVGVYRKFFCYFQLECIEKEYVKEKKVALKDFEVKFITVMKVFLFVYIQKYKKGKIIACTCSYIV